MLIPSRRLVVCTAEGQYGIVRIETRAEFPSEVTMTDGLAARLIRVTDRYVLYRELPYVASAA